MPYIGSKPSTSFVSMSKQDLTGSSGGSVTLSHAVANANEIALYINNVRQEPTESYTVNGSTLNFNGYTVSASDDIYVIFLGKAIQTTVPPDGSVTSAKLDTNIAVSGNLTVSGAFTSQGIDDNADATAITIDSSENVGIGETTPQSKLHIKTADASATAQSGSALVIEGTDATRADLQFLGDATAFQAINFGDNSDADIGRIAYDHTGNSMRFQTNASEGMRIVNNGNVLIGTTNELPGVNNTGVGISLRGASTANSIIVSRDSAVSGYFNRNSNGDIIAFRRSGTQEGSISVTTTATSYNTTSDHRLKQSVTYDFDATTRLKQLKPCRFNFIADADTTVDGFLAHEVQSVVPEAITGTHNEVDDDDNPVYQQIDQSKLVPLLVKTIQELEARITALENS